MFKENIEEFSEEEKMAKEEEERILKIFEEIEYEYPVIDIIQELKKGGDQNADETILWAINEGLLEVSSIDIDGTVYLALTTEGEDLWKELRGKKSEVSKSNNE